MAPGYLIWGDRVLAEPAATRLAAALGEKLGCEPQVHRRPARLAPLLADLKTFSLFESAKVMVIVDSAVLGDVAAAAGLIEDAAAVVPVDAAGGDPTPREQQAALRLLQALRLFQIDPYEGRAMARIEELPDWALQGRRPSGGRGPRRKRSPAKVRQLREALGGLLELAREAELVGQGEGEVEELAALLGGGAPEGHALILAESSVAPEHPIVDTLGRQGAVVRLESVEHDRRQGWQGVGALCDELARETGVGLAAAARRELERRTLRTGSRGQGVEADSTARFAAEYRKLANMAADSEIDLQLVERSVEDRGQEDPWGILDAIGGGRAGDALGALARLLDSADDPVSERLAFFALLAAFCRQVTAVGGMLRTGGAKAGERNYGRFKSGIAPRLQADLAGGRRNPLAGLHPFRLHRAYLAASGMPRIRLAELPARILDTELALKGDSRSPDAALAALVSELSCSISGGRGA